jgi:hypothetical protein
MTQAEQFVKIASTNPDGLLSKQAWDQIPYGTEIDAVTRIMTFPDDSFVDMISLGTSSQPEEMDRTIVGYILAGSRVPVPSKASPKEWSGTSDAAATYVSAGKMADDGEILKGLGYTTVGMVSAEVNVSDGVTFWKNIGIRCLPDVDVALRQKAKAFMTPDSIVGFITTVHGMKVYSKAEPETKH